jgi:hypothetical protein
MATDKTTSAQNAPVAPLSLTSDEQRLIQAFRSIGNNERQMVLGTTEACAARKGKKATLVPHAIVGYTRGWR